jgi:hypothetical protein
VYFYFNRNDKRKTLFWMFVYFNISDFDLSWTPISTFREHISMPLFNALSQVPANRNETSWLKSRLCALCSHWAYHCQLTDAVYVVQWWYLSCYKLCHSPSIIQCIFCLHKTFLFSHN